MRGGRLAGRSMGEVTSGGGVGGDVSVGVLMRVVVEAENSWVKTLAVMEDMLREGCAVVVGMIGESGWRLCISFALFYPVLTVQAGFSDGRLGLMQGCVRGLLIPMCCLHWGILSI